MTLTINDTTMTSDQTAHTARHAPERNGWEVSWLPGQILDRNTAITAMILADTAAEQDLHEGHRLWPHIQGWAEEVGLTAPDAIARASQPPGDINRQQDKPAGSQTARQPIEQHYAASRPAQLARITKRQRASFPRETPHDRCMRPITA